MSIFLMEHRYLRNSGILLHIATLPGDYGIGSFGRQAYAFADFLKSSGQRFWQILPLVPTGYGDSPYQSCCSYAGNEYFIDLDTLTGRGLLTAEETASAATETDSRIDYARLFFERSALLKKAFSRFDTSDGEFAAFLKRGEYRDYAFFRTIKEHFGHIEFTGWPAEFKYRDPAALARFEEEHCSDILFWQWAQFEFDRQWQSLKSYVNGLGIEIIGDIPIYVSRDSVECWTRPELFKLDKDLHPVLVAGCPPDYFSRLGQLWGNPIYDWERMEKEDFAWWRERMEKVGRLYDVVRIDHFRGFDRYYEIPASDGTAVNGVWSRGPGARLFERLRESIGETKIIAEDLGELDESCMKMLMEVGYPGMKILSFAFDSDETNSYLPSNYTDGNSVVYTGTHDNDTLMSLIGSLGDRHAAFAEAVADELERNGMEMPLSSDGEIADAIIALAMNSKADLAIIPVQDWLKTGGEGRINFPSTLSPLNWSYRINPSQLTDSLSRRIAELTEKSGRYNR